VHAEVRRTGHARDVVVFDHEHVGVVEKNFVKSGSP
jgi:hypothetical protein